MSFSVPSDELDPAGRDRAGVEEDARQVEAGAGHQHPGDRLVAAGEQHGAVEALGHHDGLDRVGDDLAAHEREVHALVAHRDAVRDRDRAELQRVAPAGVHALLGALREPVEAQVAGGDLVPARRDADLRLVPVRVAHADGAQHSARGRGLDAVRDDAAAGFDVDASYPAKTFLKSIPGRCVASARAGSTPRPILGCFPHAPTRRFRRRRRGCRGRPRRGSPGRPRR